MEKKGNYLWELELIESIFDLCSFCNSKGYKIDIVNDVRNEDNLIEIKFRLIAGNTYIEKKYYLNTINGKISESGDTICSVFTTFKQLVSKL